MADRLQYPFQNDHDVFIALIEDFNASVASLDHRMLEDHNATLEIKGLLQKQYETLSQRIDGVEQELRNLRPEEMAQLKEDVKKSNEWIHDFNRTKHIAWIIASSGFLLMGYYIPQLILNIEAILHNGK